MLKAKQMFLKCFYDHAIKYFHDGLNIVVFLSPGCEQLQNETKRRTFFL